MTAQTFGGYLIRIGAIDGFGGLGRMVKEFAQSDSKVHFGQYLQDLYPDEYVAWRTCARLMGADGPPPPTTPDKE